MTDLQMGAVVRLRTFRHYPEPGTGVISLDYSAPKDEVFVVAILGTEPRDGSKPLDPLAVFDAMGWQEKPDTTTEEPMTERDR